MVKHKSVLISALLLGTALLCGCNDASVENISADNVAIEFSWWGNDNRHAYTMDGVDLFQDISDNILVNCRYGEWSGYEKRNRVWMESNTESDVMQINYAWLTSYSADGTGYYDLYTLGDYIDFDQFDETDLQYGERNGKLNAIPIAFNTSTIGYNEDIFKKYNLEYPTTWEDFFTVAEVLREDGIYTLGMEKKHMLLMLIAYYEQTYGKNVFTEDGKLLIDREGIGYMLDFYIRLIDEKVLMPINQFERAKFGSGECAGSVFWISDADNYCKTLVSNDYTPHIGAYPSVSGSLLTGIYMKPATMYAISSITDYPEESAKLLNFLLNNEEMILLQGTEKGVPVSKKAVEILKENDQLNSYGYKAYEQMQTVKEKLNVMIPIMESEDIIDAFKTVADKYIYDVADRDDCIEEIYTAIAEIVGE